MRYGEFLQMVFANIATLFPFLGIIRFEEQFVLWHIALGSVTIGNLMPRIITVLAIYFVVAYAVFGNQHPFRGGHHLHLGGVLRTLWRFIVVVAFSWFFLLYGVVCEYRAANGQDVSTDVGNATIHGHHRFGTYTRISLHFRIGRWLFRGINWFLGLFLHNVRVRTGIAIAIALTICLMGFWEIPADLSLV